MTVCIRLRFTNTLSLGLLLALTCLTATCQAPRTRSAGQRYEWTRLTESAEFPKSYNFRVFVANGKMYAFHGDGTWISSDGRSWTKISLPALRPDAYTTQYVQFRDSIYALGNNRGNYERMTFASSVRRTRDYRTWESVADRTNLPGRIFPTIGVFRDKIWLIGGYDGNRFYSDVWNSSDGVTWTRVIESAGWSPRANSGLVVFKDRMWLLGGAVIDGMLNDNPGSAKEIWSSSDGINWGRIPGEMPAMAGGTPVVFDEELWLVGANRDGTFGRSSLVTSDLRRWREEEAPWSPRGAVATWVLDNKLYMTGGKYSVNENGNIRFIYSNDVWVMSKIKETQ